MYYEHGSGLLLALASSKIHPFANRYRQCMKWYTKIYPDLFRLTPYNPDLCKVGNYEQGLGSVSTGFKIHPYANRYRQCTKKDFYSDPRLHNSFITIHSYNKFTLNTFKGTRNMTTLLNNRYFIPWLLLFTKFYLDLP